jgi:glycosyltransferase involved in cell wall biosynthesis
MNLPALSIVIRSKNDASLIGKTLEGVVSQEYPAPVRRVHIDSGSTDDTCQIIRDSKPDQFLQIRAEDYVPGRVLNTGMKLTTEDWVVFLNSDAEPVGRHWLSNLLRVTLERSDFSKEVGAVFGRQIPRPGCLAVYAHDYERCFGPERESQHWPHFFSMVSSAVSRAAWLEQPFREDLQYSEDEEWSRRLKQNGWTVAYADESVVVHSHNYTLAEARKRTYGDGFAYAATAPETPAGYSFVNSVLLGGARDSLRDLIYCARSGKLVEWPHAVAVRYAQRLGKRAGFLAGWKHYDRSS